MIAHEDRFIPLDGACNFRDLGGLPTSNGGTTRTGMMFRSDALHHLQASDVSVLADLGMRMVIDLRSTGELERTGRGLLGETDVQWLHAPLTHSGTTGEMTIAPALAAGDLGRHYVESLDARTETLATVIERLSARVNLPAVFHCAAGKDRTGVVAALVLSLVGVPDDVIVHDYTLTDDRMATVLERFRSAGAPPDSATRMDARVFRAEATSMETFLAALHDGYGGASGWASRAGLSEETLSSLRAVLVAD